MVKLQEFICSATLCNLTKKVFCMYFTVKYRLKICCICDGNKIVLVFPRKSRQMNQKGVLTAVQSLLLTFPTYLWCCRGAFVSVEWMTQCSKNKLALIWVCACIWIGLIHRTVCTAGTVGLQDPIICVNISDQTQQNCVCCSYAQGMKNYFVS